MYPAPRLVYPRCLGHPQVDPQLQGPPKECLKKKGEYLQKKYGHEKIPP